MPAASFGRPSASALFCSLLIVCTAAGQTSWTERNPTNAPSPRTAHGLAYHAGTQQVVLFGGCGGGLCFGDTWLWDGQDWTLSPAMGPAPRFGHVMTYDSERDRIVLFGGGDLEDQLFNDTWEWDGAAWQRVATAGPSPRWNFAMAYDPVRRHTVLFGGSNLTHQFDETWIWSRGSWRSSFQFSSPPTLSSPAMAWDGNSNRLLLFSGWDLGPPSLLTADTWSFDGGWLRLHISPGTPFARYAHSMAWDSARERVVMFGGTGFIFRPPYFGDTHEWDGLPASSFENDAWMRRLGPAPAARAWSPIAFDAAREEVVLFGGNDDTTVLGDTHTYGPDVPASATEYGIGCAGAASSPVLSAVGNSRPWLGEGLELNLDQVGPLAAAFAVGSSQSQWRGLALPLPLGPLSPGCSILASPDLVLGALSVAGSAQLELAIPASPALTGQSFFVQGVSLDPAPPLGAVFSNGLAATVGEK
ncbi:MAG: kelch repeat-containing protein [Planctomycetota bacterium]